MAEVQRAMMGQKEIDRAMTWFTDLFSTSVSDTQTVQGRLQDT
jgi:hypothetical protein